MHSFVIPKLWEKCPLTPKYRSWLDFGTIAASSSLKYFRNLLISYTKSFFKPYASAFNFLFGLSLREKTRK